MNTGITGITGVAVKSDPTARAALANGRDENRIPFGLRVG